VKVKGGLAMRTKGGLVLEKPDTNNLCKHHWVIEPPNGPFSRGKCKQCGAEKVFDNILADLLAQKDLAEPFDSDNSEDSTGKLEEIAS